MVDCYYIYGGVGLLHLWLIFITFVVGITFMGNTHIYWPHIDHVNLFTTTVQMSKQHNSSGMIRVFEFPYPIPNPMVQYW